MKTKHRCTAAKEYEEKGAAMAVELFVQLKVRPVSIASSQEIRDCIETLADDQLLQTTIGDFWLGLTKGEGQERRKFDPTPPNPYVHKDPRPFDEGGDHRSRLGKKSEIEKWEGHWRTLEAAAVYANSGALKARQIGKALRKTLPWLEHEVDGIIAAINDMTLRSFQNALADPAALAIKHYTVSTALRRRWHDPEERALWIARLEAAHRQDEMEIRKLAMQDLADHETRKLGRARLPDSGTKI